MNKIVKDICVQIFLWTNLFISLGKYLGMRWLKDHGLWLLLKKATKCFPKPWRHFITQPCPPHALQHLVRSVYLVLSIPGVLFNGCIVFPRNRCDFRARRSRRQREAHTWRRLLALQLFHNRFHQRRKQCSFRRR